jgi:pyrroloquinoline quinone (PQQ) biosynthesis protein C
MTLWSTEAQLPEISADRGFKSLRAHFAVASEPASDCKLFCEVGFEPDESHARECNEVSTPDRLGVVQIPESLSRIIRPDT